MLRKSQAAVNWDSTVRDPVAPGGLDLAALDALLARPPTRPRASPRWRASLERVGHGRRHE
jgi:hypothetical protein